MDPTNHIFYQGEYQGRHFFCITVEDRMQQVRRAEREELEHMLTYDHTLSPPLQQTVRLAAESRLRRLKREEANHDA